MTNVTENTSACANQPQRETVAQHALVLIAHCPKFQLLPINEPRFYDTGWHAAMDQELDNSVAYVAAFGLVLVTRGRGIVRVGAVVQQQSFSH
jgi:hypothetical protein